MVMPSKTAATDAELAELWDLINVGFVDWLTLWQAIGVAEYLKSDAGREELPNWIALLLFKAHQLDTMLARLELARPEMMAKIFTANLFKPKAVP